MKAGRSTTEDATPAAQAAFNEAMLLYDAGAFDQATEVALGLFHAAGPLADRALLLVLMVPGCPDARALPLLAEACTRYPDDARWPAALATRTMDQGDLETALACADEALRRDPDHPVVGINRAIWLASQWGDSAESRALMEDWCRRHLPTQDPWPAGRRAASAPPRRLRIGYVSGDLREHAVRPFIEPVLRHHNRSAFEVHAFMTLPGDAVTATLQPLVEHWHDVAGWDDDTLLALLRGLQLDVLVDLSGHTKGERLAVFARRAAPIQVTWFGFMQTLGLPAIDWRLSDARLIPPHREHAYTERIMRLESSLAYAPPPVSVPLYPPPGARNRFTTLICLNHPRKISTTMLLAWAAILQAHPHVRLLLMGAPQAGGMPGLATRVAAAGLPAERVTLLGRLPLEDFMQLAAVADCALDTLPVSGGTTTLHALWMGLPVLTVRDPQQGALAHYTAAIEECAGLADECVTGSLTEYIARAGEWIASPSRMAALRARCRPALLASPMMDARTHTQTLEAAYRRMVAESPRDWPA